jgi:drug/metabolite transporter (DMT)-like permease
MQGSSVGFRPTLIILVALLSLGWGFSWPMMKIALSEFPVWTFRAASCLLAGLCVLGIARLSEGRHRPSGSEWGRVMLAALFNVTGWHMLIGYGVPLVPAGHAAVLAYTMPLWVVLIGTGFLREPLELPTFGGLVLGLAGVATLVSPDLSAFSEAPLGVLLVLLGALSWAIGTLVQKHYRTGLSTLGLTGWQLVLGSLPILALAPVIEGVHFPQVSERAWLSGVYVTVVALVICYFLWFKIVSLMPAGKASVSTLLVPALGVVSGALFLGEPLGAREVIALLLMAAALTLVLTPPVRLASQKTD